ncbi:DUF2390 domain-containing protein [Marinobacter sp. VGCF2001]|uniref:DUF2390 domain-containing protein n=1 Tax=Marinobacter sp. VGCF2001 TaxID=3417189 RepID=UPI003CEECE86
MTVQHAEPLELPTDMEPDNPLWRYALAQWQDPEIARVCLELQSEGWSVTRILCAGWLATRGQAFSGAEDAKVTEWRTRVTGCLRSARKSVPRANASGEALRETMAKAELLAEQLELALAWQSLSTTKPEIGHMQEPGTLIRQNLFAAAPCRNISRRQTHQLDLLASRLADQTTGGETPCT